MYKIVNKILQTHFKDILPKVIMFKKKQINGNNRKTNMMMTQKNFKIFFKLVSK